MDTLNTTADLIPGRWSATLCGSATMAALGLRDVLDLDVLVPPSALSDLEVLGPPEGWSLRPSLEDENPYPDGRTLIRYVAPNGVGVDVFSELPRVGALIGEGEPRTFFRGGRRFLAPEIVMAIKCLVPRSHPKFARHMTDVAMLAASHARGEW